MALRGELPACANPRIAIAARSILIGVTNPQTCLILRERVRIFRDAGYRVMLSCSPGPLLYSIAQEEGIEVVSIPMRRDIAPFADLRSFFLLCRAICRLKPDLTEFSTPKAGLLGSLAALLCGVGVRVYLLRGLRLETASGIKRQLMLWSERVAAASSNSVLCNSESLRNKAVALNIAPEAKLCLIGKGSSNGVDVERFHPGPDTVRRGVNIPSRVPVIGFVGRLTRDKGVPELVEAFEQILTAFPGAWLLLVGWFDQSEDALSHELRLRIQRHPRIVCTGFVADTAPFYRAMDVMVLPTWREGFPNVILEAAATGLPVVTTLSTGSRDAVVPEVTGLLIPPGYPEAIAEAVQRLLRDPNLRHKMGRAARAWVKERYRNERVLGLTVTYYDSLLRRQPLLAMEQLTEEQAVAAD